MKIKGWIHKVISIPYTGKADKKLIEQSIKTLIDSIEGAKVENTKRRVGGGFLLQ